MGRAQTSFGDAVEKLHSVSSSSLSKETDLLVESSPRSWRMPVKLLLGKILLSH